MDDVEVKDQDSLKDQGSAAQTEEVTFAEDNDPMLAEMRKAEEEIKAAEGKEVAEESEATENAEKDQPAAEKNGKAVMIPKERLDQVLAERDHYKNATNYLQGIVDTQGQMIKGGTAAPVDQKAQNEGKAAVTEPAANDYNALIEKVEDAKIDLAKRYEDGEISLVEFQTEQVKLDRDIRKHEEARTAEMVKGVESKAQEVVQANNKALTVNDAALEIQQQHPYVAAIDELPPAIAQGIWNQITQEATQALAAIGINVKDGSPETHIALMREKAALTDKYGPQYTGKQLQASSQGQSQTAQDRARKLDLAEQQPPVTSGASAGNKAELSEADVENMTDDQVADYLAANPSAVLKAAGIHNR